MRWRFFEDAKMGHDSTDSKKDPKKRTAMEKSVESGKKEFRAKCKEIVEEFQSESTDRSRCQGQSVKDTLTDVQFADGDENIHMRIDKDDSFYDSNSDSDEEPMDESFLSEEDQTYEHNASELSL